MGRFAALDRPDVLELDAIAVVGLEQPPASAEQDGHEVDLKLVELARREQRLRRACPVHHHSPIASGRPSFGGAGGDVIEVRHEGRRFVVFVNVMGQDMDRHAVVMIAAPPAGELVGATTRNQGTGRQRLGVHLAVGTRSRPVVGLVEQAPTVATELLPGAVVRSGDEPVQGHRHVEPDRCLHLCLL
jgi:hypothetical protein